ncbi:hypothetical protein OLZ34_25005, partial [Escherichia coli]|nr:hypothetical protein [Escherichia coli]
FRSPGTAPAPCKAYSHGTGSYSVGRWSQTVDVAAMGGLGFSPRRFPVALKALPEPWRIVI